MVLGVAGGSSIETFSVPLLLLLLLSYYTSLWAGEVFEIGHSLGPLANSTSTNKTYQVSKAREIKKNTSLLFKNAANYKSWQSIK